MGFVFRSYPMAQTRLAFLTTVVVIDLAATVLMGTVTGGALSVVVTIAFFRPAVLFVAFGGVLLALTLSAPPSPTRFAGACGLFYVLFPFCLWALKPGIKSATDVYWDLYTHADLFVLMCLPFLLASGISLYLVRNSSTPEGTA